MLIKWFNVHNLDWNITSIFVFLTWRQRFLQFKYFKKLIQHIVGFAAPVWIEAVTFTERTALHDHTPVTYVSSSLDWAPALLPVEATLLTSADVCLHKNNSYTTKSDIYTHTPTQRKQPNCRTSFSSKSSNVGLCLSHFRLVKTVDTHLNLC